MDAHVALSSTCACDNCEGCSDLDVDGFLLSPSRFAPLGHQLLVGRDWGDDADSSPRCGGLLSPDHSVMFTARADRQVHWPHLRAEGSPRARPSCRTMPSTSSRVRSTSSGPRVPGEEVVTPRRRWRIPAESAPLHRDAHLADLLAAGPISCSSGVRRPESSGSSGARRHASSSFRVCQRSGSASARSPVRRCAAPGPFSSLMTVARARLTRGPLIIDPPPSAAVCVVTHAGSVVARRVVPCESAMIRCPRVPRSGSRSLPTSLRGSRPSVGLHRALSAPRPPRRP